ncbi:MAG: hypothetical protein MUF85_03060, partial [Patescibacteria group bacterium]|nr:hypothetical protein [Patescibacteria group bacterium]
LNAISAKFKGLWAKDKINKNKILLAHAGPEEGIANKGETGRPSLVATFIDETEYEKLNNSGKLPTRITYIVYPVSSEWVRDMYNSPLPVADDVLVLEVDGDELTFRSISNRGVFEYQPYNIDPQDLEIIFSNEGLIDEIIKMPTQAGYSASLLHRLAYSLVEIPHSELPINLRITHFTGNYYGAVKQDP